MTVVNRTFLVAVSGAALALGLAGMIGTAGARSGSNWQDRANGADRGPVNHRARFMRRAISEDMARERARVRFARFDKNSDGVLDASEIEARLLTRRANRNRGRMQRHSERRWVRRLARLDQNRDGKISKAEFADQQKKRFMRLDLNNDGRISDADLPPHLRGRDLLVGAGSGSAQTMPFASRRGFRGGRKARRMGRQMRRLMMLRAADKNSDGEISRAEFAEAAARRFERQDYNGNGSIERADRDARRAAGRAYRVRRFIHRFGIDADQAKQVTRQQFEQAALARFARRDLNRDGTITRDEMPRRAHKWRNGHKRRPAGNR